MATYDDLKNISEAPTVLDDAVHFNIERGNITISQYLYKKNLESHISLDADKIPTAELVKPDDRIKQYTIGRLIAKGGMGTILNAKDWNCRRDVAMKIINNSGNVSSNQVLRFIVEAQITAQLQHPAIIPVYEVSIDTNENVYYTMKMVQGKTLTEILGSIQEGDQEYIDKYPLIKLLTIFIRVCEAVAFAHSKGVVHRDLKPDNIMIGEYGEVLLMDWGLAKLMTTHDAISFSGDKTNKPEIDYTGIESILSDPSTQGTFKTIDGQIMGTPGYMPPEQALGKVDDINARSDIYALGGILYHILTLRPTLKDYYSVREVVKQIVVGDFPPPSSFNSSNSFPHCPNKKIPEALSAVAMKALEAQAEKRYGNATELLDDIEKYLGGFATSVEVPNLLTLIRLLVRRRKKELIWGAVTLLLILLMTITFMIKIVEAKNEAEGNLQKFLQEQIVRQELSHKLLVNTMEVLNQANPSPQGLTYNHSLTKNEFRLDLSGNQELIDIHPLRNLPLTHLDLSNTGVTDLDALAELPLAWLNLENTRIKDINMLQKCPLVYLDLANTKIDDLAGLTQPGLMEINIAGLNMADLSPLKGLSLKRLTIDGHQMKHLPELRQLGLLHLTIHDPDKVQLYLLKDFPLISLKLSGRSFSELNYLKDIKISRLDLVDTKVRDLSPLAPIRLTSLRLFQCAISDITPLTTMALKELQIEKCYFLQDISGLEKCVSLEKLLIPPHITTVDFLKKLPKLKVLANNYEDFTAAQTPQQFFVKLENESADKPAAITIESNQ